MLGVHRLDDAGAGEGLGWVQILEASEGVLEPITHALFSELTVLGFLGLVTFALQKARVFNLIGAPAVSHLRFTQRFQPALVC